MIPAATVRRLPVYLRFLEEIDSGLTTVGSADIAKATGGTAVQVRKDLSHLRYSGTRGVGYDVTALRTAIERALGLGTTRRVALVGAGNLGTALAGYTGFLAAGFRIEAVYDRNPRRIGALLNDMVVQSIDDLPSDAGIAPFEIGVIATPAEAAQSVADLLVSAAIGGIVNFTTTRLRVPETVTVRNVDLSTEFRILSHYLA